MIVGVSKIDWTGTSPFVERFMMLLEKNGVEVIRLDPSTPDFLERVAGVDLFIYWPHHNTNDKTIVDSLLPVIEQDLKVPTLPNQRTRWHFDDKVRQGYLAQACDLPLARTWTFWDRQSALDWLGQADFPLVFKLKGGASSRSVILVRGLAHATKLVNRMFRRGMVVGRIPLTEVRVKDGGIKRYVRMKLGSAYRRWKSGSSAILNRHKNYIMFQEFLPGNSMTVRVVVIGGRAFVYHRFNGENDFRVHGSLQRGFEKHEEDAPFVKAAFEISDRMGFQVMGYDFLSTTSGSPVACEFGHAFPDKYIHDCAGYWGRGLDWHEGHFWPQACMLEDLLGRDKVPENCELDQDPQVDLWSCIKKKNST